MDKYTIYCNYVQIRKALELGAPIEAYSIKEAPNSWCGKACLIGGTTFALPPTAEQMLGWLEEQNDILSIEITFESQIKWKWELFTGGDYDMAYPFFSRKEATLAAIDAALDYLIDKKNAKRYENKD